MEELLIIKSAQGAGTLELSSPEPAGPVGSVEYFLVTLKLEGLRAACRVYTPSFYDGPEDLAQLFDDLAVNWRGWTGNKGWGSLEGEIRITYTCDKLGHTEMRVALRRHLEWEVSGTLVVEAGQLENIAREVRRFLRA